MSTRRTYRRTAVTKVNSDALLVLSQEYPGSCPRVGLDTRKAKSICLSVAIRGCCPLPSSVVTRQEVCRVTQLMRQQRCSASIETLEWARRLPASHVAIDQAGVQRDGVDLDVGD